MAVRVSKTLGPIMPNSHSTSRELPLPLPPNQMAAFTTLIKMHFITTTIHYFIHIFVVLGGYFQILLSNLLKIQPLRLTIKSKRVQSVSTVTSFRKRRNQAVKVKNSLYNSASTEYLDSEAMSNIDGTVMQHVFRHSRGTSLPSDGKHVEFLSDFGQKMGKIVEIENYFNGQVIRRNNPGIMLEASSKLCCEKIMEENVEYLGAISIGDEEFHSMEDKNLIKSNFISSASCKCGCLSNCNKMIIEMDKGGLESTNKFYSGKIMRKGVEYLQEMDATDGDFHPVGDKMWSKSDFVSAALYKDYSSTDKIISNTGKENFEITNSQVDYEYGIHNFDEIKMNEMVEGESEVDELSGIDAEMAHSDSLIETKADFDSTNDEVELDEFSIHEAEMEEDESEADELTDSDGELTDCSESDFCDDELDVVFENSSLDDCVDVSDVEFYNESKPQPCENILCAEGATTSIIHSLIVPIWEDVNTEDEDWCDDYDGDKEVVFRAQNSLYYDLDEVINQTILSNCESALSQEVIDANKRWNAIVTEWGDVTTAAIGGKHVCFQEDVHVTIHDIPIEDRFGTWCIDAQRFQHKIACVKEVIDPILDSEHRRKIRTKIGC